MNARLLISLATLSLSTLACDQPKEEPAPAPSAAPEAKAAKEAPKDADEPKAADPHAEFANLAAEEVETLLAKKGCVPVDANGAETREKYGIVPGAVLLSGADYEAKELPEDKATKLVFYCGGEKCTAAPKAAKIAKKAGYSDVNVMRVGIRGWVEAGKKTDKPAT